MSRGSFFFLWDPTESRGVPRYPTGEKNIPRDVPRGEYVSTGIPAVTQGLGCLHSRNLCLMMVLSSHRTYHGDPQDPMGRTSGTPEGSPGKFERIPAGSHGITRGPGRSRGSYWDYPRYTVGSHWTSYGLPCGSPVGSRGIAREFPGSHRKSRKNVSHCFSFPKESMSFTTT